MLEAVQIVAASIVHGATSRLEQRLDERDALSEHREQDLSSRLGRLDSSVAKHSLQLEELDNGVLGLDRTMADFIKERDRPAVSLYVSKDEEEVEGGEPSGMVADTKLRLELTETQQKLLEHTAELRGLLFENKEAWVQENNKLREEMSDIVSVVTQSKTRERDSEERTELFGKQAMTSEDAAALEKRYYIQ